MRREAELRRKLRSLRALEEAMGAMKSLSAHHLREARAAVEPARDYRQAVERIVRSSRASVAAGDAGAGLLVIGGELGLCGSYNAQVVQLAAARRAELGAGPSSCVGHRAASMLARRSVAVQTVYAGPTSVQGITGLLLRLAEDLLTQYVTQRLASVDIVASCFAGVGRTEPRSVRLLPLAAADGTHATAIRAVSREQLASASVREYLYITLYDVLLDALASEHGARLVATQSAEQWLKERSARLQRYLTATRRESSTQEMLEIAAGARGRRRGRG